MTLPVGSSLSCYEILGPLGAGAMGEVYRARDTRLEREVAIKVLPEHFASDGERLRRFEREAKTLASLNHPNVAQIFGVDQVGDTCFLVLELVPGESLEERLKRGPLPLDEALDACRQIAEGLEAAHEAGVIHRDLKPANIRVTPDGKVKVLDFGLAKSVIVGEQHSSDSVLSTEHGRLLGTPTYMVPEQARGRHIDRRVDIWAFGCVLYECLTSQRAFTGETLTDVLGAVLHTTPDLARLPAGTPRSVRELLARCLEKDPHNRLRDIGEARLLLGDRAALVAAEAAEASAAVASAAAAAAAASDSAARGGRAPWLPWTLAGATVLVAVFFGLRGGRQPPLPLPDATPTLTAATPSPRTFTPRTFGPQFVCTARFLPHAQGIVYSSALTGNRPEMFLLQTGAMAPQRIAPAGTVLLSISSSGELAVLTDATYFNHRLFVGTLARMTIDGAPRALIDEVRDADWGRDGELAVVRRLDGLDQLEYPSGKALYTTTGYVSEPRVSPDGTRVAFLDHTDWLDDRGWVKVVDRAGNVTTLSDECSALEGLTWEPGGARLLFSGARSGGSARMSPLSTSASGPDVRDEFDTPGEMFLLDAADDGRLLAIEADTFYGVGVRLPGRPADLDVSWLDQSWGGQLSPDGTSVVFSNGHGGPNYTVVTRRLDGSPITTLGEGDARGYSPDGRWVVAQLFTPCGLVLYPTGAGAARPLERGPLETITGAAWFPDGKSLLVTGAEKGRRLRCYRQPIDGGPPEAVTPEGFAGTLSPLGDRIICRDAKTGWVFCALDGGAAVPVPGLDALDDVEAWTPAGDGVYVQRFGAIPARLDHVDLATGTRTAAFVLGPESQAGLVRVVSAERVLDPQRAYAYGYYRRLSQLFVVEGGR